MIDQKENQKVSPHWINHLHETITDQCGTFTVKDAQGVPIMLEWEKVEAHSPRINKIIKEAAEILAYTYVTMEIQFARKHPQSVTTEMFLKPLEPLFAKGVELVDWNTAEDTLQESLMQFFRTTDFTRYGNAQDVHLFVRAKDVQTNALLGMINFIGMKDFEDGSLKVAYFGLKKNSENRGLEIVLMSTIFKLVPTVTRLFLHTRITNRAVLQLYRTWGFTQFDGPLAFWTDMEYLTEESDLLQRTAKTIIE